MNTRSIACSAKPVLALSDTMHRMPKALSFLQLRLEGATRLAHPTSKVFMFFVMRVIDFIADKSGRISFSREGLGVASAKILSVYAHEPTQNYLAFQRGSAAIRSTSIFCELLPSGSNTKVQDLRYVTVAQRLQAPLSKRRSQNGWPAPALPSRAVCLGFRICSIAL